MASKCILFIMVLMFLPVKTVSATLTYAQLFENTQAVVLQVIDGEAFSVQPVGTNQEVLVRLAGISTQGSREAREFMSNAVLGRTVDIILSFDDSSNPRYSDRWVPVYLAYEGVVYNRSLVQRGLAVVDTNYAGQWLYESLLSDVNRAQGATLGMWVDDGFNYQPIIRGQRQDESEWDVRVNINTATVQQLNRYLYNLSLGRGRAIENHRSNGQFRSVDEVKFTGVFSRESYDYFKNRMVVSTNINTASEEELMQLIGVNQSDARNIIRFRQRTPFHTVSQLRDERLITERAFEQNRPFIAVYDVDVLESARLTVDVNTATAEELRKAGLNAAQANAVIGNRTNGYTLKSVGELQSMTGVRVTDRQLNEIAHTIRVGNIEGWHQANGRSLVNINTASGSELRGIGFSEEQVSLVIDRVRRMNSARDIPFDVSMFDRDITLFTNINTASERELLSLSPRMSGTFANMLSFEASNQPFGTWDELENFFRANGQLSLYNEIEVFLVLR